MWHHSSDFMHGWLLKLQEEMMATKTTMKHVAWSSILTVFGELGYFLFQFLLPHAVSFLHMFPVDIDKTRNGTGKKNECRCIWDCMSSLLPIYYCLFVLGIEKKEGGDPLHLFRSRPINIVTTERSTRGKNLADTISLSLEKWRGKRIKVTIYRHVDTFVIVNLTARINFCRR